MQIRIFFSGVGDGGGGGGGGGVFQGPFLVALYEFGIHTPWPPPMGMFLLFNMTTSTHTFVFSLAFYQLYISGEKKN